MKLANTLDLTIDISTKKNSGLVKRKTMVFIITGNQGDPNVIL